MVARYSYGYAIKIYYADSFVFLSSWSLHYICLFLRSFLCVLHVIKYVYCILCDQWYSDTLCMLHERSELMIARKNSLMPTVNNSMQGKNSSIFIFYVDLCRKSCIWERFLSVCMCERRTESRQWQSGREKQTDTQRSRERKELCPIM